MTRRSDRGEMKGAQRHAEGDHGPETRSRIREEVQSPNPNPKSRRGARAPEQKPRDAHPPDGEHRLFEHREQRDPADEQSDRNRLAKDRERHGHDR